MKKLPSKTAVILGTGPSLNLHRRQIQDLSAQGKISVFGVNNTYRDFTLDVLIACDPLWHDRYSPIDIPNCDQWHWDASICSRYGYKYIEGRWGEGLSLDKRYIHYGHSSGYQAIGLATHYGCKTLLLCGYDMRYQKNNRHYFDELSDKPGEYPPELRKYSTFDGLIACYETIAQQTKRPYIINCTPNSALRCFPYFPLSVAVGDNNYYE